MRSSFFELNVAKSALFVAKGNMEIASHNIANSGIKGYSRQYAIQRASTPLPQSGGRGMVGTGSEIYGIGQMRNFYLDKKFWSHSATYGEYDIKKTQLTEMESLMNDLSGTGLTASFSNFFDELHSLTTSPQDATYRSNILQIGETLTDFVNTLAQEMSKQQKDVNGEIRIVVSEINSLGRQISNLNRQIYTYEMDGSRANDLRDERARLVDTLSAYANVEVTETDGKYCIQMNGYGFVDHFDFNAMEVRTRDEGDIKNPSDSAYLYDIYFSGSNIKFDIYSSTLKGELKGLIDIRDGNGGENLMGTTTSYKGIPYYFNKLNDLVRTFARAIDEGKNSKGEALNGVTGVLYGYDSYGNTGKTRFFINDGYDGSDPLNFDYSKLNCFNFTVNPALIEDPKLLGCEDTNDKGENNNNVILSLLKIKDDKTLFNQGRLSDYILRMTGDLAISLDQAERFEQSYYDVLASVDYQRMSVSGVDTTEEFTMIVQYQNLYQAASKLISIIDNIYQTTINLGL